MMRIIMVVIGLVSGVNNFLVAQIFSTKTAEVGFFSKAPLENIEAHSKTSESAIRITDRYMEFKVPIKSLHFEKPLMEEHFNENYLESSKYPHATFTGKVIEFVDLSKPGEYDVTARGKLTVHGITKERTIKGKITVTAESITMDSKFDVFLKDHKVDIPKMVLQNIAEKVEVTVHSVNLPK